MWKVWCKVRFAHCVNWNGEKMLPCVFGKHWVPSPVWDALLDFVLTHPTSWGLAANFKLDGFDCYWCVRQNGSTGWGCCWQLKEWSFLLVNCAHLESLRENGLQRDPEGSLCTLFYKTMAGENHTWDFCSLDTNFDFVQLWLCSLHKLHLGSDLLVCIHVWEKSDVICHRSFSA